MSKRIEYIKGQIINKLIFIEEIEGLVTKSGIRRKASWKCYCGKEFNCQISAVKTGNTKSCGCHRLLGAYNIKHGDAARDNTHYLYNLWHGIKKRCYNPKTKEFKYWGGRGIQMQAEWKDNYPLFKQQILETIGDKPSQQYSLDRYPNNDGNYEISNLRWATKSEQNYNSRNSKQLAHV